MRGFQGQRKLTTSEVLILNINKLSIKRNSKFTSSVNWGENNSIGLDKITENEVVLRYENTCNGTKKNFRYTVGIDYTPCNYGGERSWFICPDCGARVGKLYQRKGRFSCRSCHNLNYSIQQEDKLDRMMESIDRKIYKVQGKLKTEKSIDNIYFVQKPKGMHYKTYEELIFRLKWLRHKRNETFCNMYIWLGGATQFRNN